MFKDKEEELKRLQQLLQEADEEEEPEEEFEEAVVDEEPEEEPVIYHNYANRYGRVRIYNNDTADRDLDSFSEEVYAPKKKTNILVLVAIAMTLVAGIMGVLSWWAVKFL